MGAGGGFGGDVGFDGVEVGGVGLADVGKGGGDVFEELHAYEGEEVRWEDD